MRPDVFEPAAPSMHTRTNTRASTTTARRDGIAGRRTGEGISNPARRAPGLDRHTSVCRAKRDADADASASRENHESTLREKRPALRERDDDLGRPRRGCPVVRSASEAIGTSSWSMSKACEVRAFIIDAFAQIANFLARPSGRSSSYSSNGWWIHGLVGSSST